MTQPHSEFGELPITALQGRWLVSRGVNAAKQVFDWQGRIVPPFYASVEFVNGNRWVPARDSKSPESCVTALLFGERDEFCQPLDIAAWQPRAGALATLEGRAWCLGTGNLGLTRFGPLTVHPGPLEWLRAGRRGLVIIDAARAAWELAGTTLAAASVAHGRALREALTLPAPRIAVPAQSHRRAA